MNASEELVFRLCQRSFLSLWSYANPLSKPGKELCDLLVVCNPDIVLFSVKDVAYKSSGEDTTKGWERWRRRAIEDSVKQLYGAERWLQNADRVIRSDGSPGIALPSTATRRIHRIAVALGSDGQVPIEFGDFGKGYVHVLDEESLDILMNELDTINDFTTYLEAKEEHKGSILFEGWEADLLALYLHQNRKIPSSADLLVVLPDVWTEFTKKDEYQRKKTVDKESYIWDRMIEIIGRDVLHGHLEFGEGLDDNETALRAMAKETRFARRMLGQSFLEMVKGLPEGNIRARMVKSPPSDIVYVFLLADHMEERKFRRAELGNRCFVARGLNSNSPRVVGIAADRPNPNFKSYSFDLCSLFMPGWSDSAQKQIEKVQTDLGYFRKPVVSKESHDEYPLS
jgi:hypothetical protein